MRSLIEAMKKIARMLRSHRSLILDYFRAKKQIALGAVEGLNLEEAGLDKLGEKWG